LKIKGKRGRGCSFQVSKRGENILFEEEEASSRRCIREKGTYTFACLAEGRYIYALNIKGEG